MGGRIKRVRCVCGRMAQDSFSGKWRHMIKYHPEAMAKKIIPLLFKPPEELISMGRAIASDFVKRLGSNER